MQRNEGTYNIAQNMEDIYAIARYLNEVEHMERQDRIEYLNGYIEAFCTSQRVNKDKIKEQVPSIVDSRSANRKMNVIDYIPISQGELDTIVKVDNLMYERTAFTLLCLAKYYNMISPNNGDWTNCDDVSIARLANNQQTAIKRGETIHELCALGLVGMAERDSNLNIKVNFISGDDVAMKVSDFRDLGYQYMKQKGYKFSRCQVCGKLIKQEKNKKPKTYCSECRSLYGYDTSHRIYVPYSDRIIKTKCCCCGKEIYVNPSKYWIESLCDECHI